MGFIHLIALFPVGAALCSAIKQLAEAALSYSPCAYGQGCCRWNRRQFLSLETPLGQFKLKLTVEQLDYRFSMEKLQLSFSAPKSIRGLFVSLKGMVLSEEPKTSASRRRDRQRH